MINWIVLFTHIPVNILFQSLVLSKFYNIKASAYLFDSLWTLNFFFFTINAFKLNLFDIHYGISRPYNFITSKFIKYLFHFQHSHSWIFCLCSSIENYFSHSFCNQQTYIEGKLLISHHFYFYIYTIYFSVAFNDHLVSLI